MTIVGILALGRTTFDVEQGHRAFTSARDLLASLVGVTVVGPSEVFTDPGTAAAAARELAATKLHALVIVYATFADNRTVQALDDVTGVPVVLWSIPEPRTGRQLARNSLCGAHLSAFELHQRGHRYVTIDVDPDADAAAEEVRRAVARCTSARWSNGHTATAPTRERPNTTGRHDLALAVTGRLRESTIGRVGMPPPGFTACEADDLVLGTTTGIHVDDVDLDRLFDVADDVDDVRLDRSRSALDRLGPRSGVSELETERSLRLHAGLSTLIERRSWAAVAVRCWPECLDSYGAAVCTPLAMTTAAGVPAVCEADVLGAATALLLRQVSGRDPFLTDLVDADRGDDTTVAWHCGSAAPSWSSTPVEVTGHPIKHMGLANQFSLRPGPVTVARLSRATGDGLSLWTASAAMLDRPRPFTGTCGTLRWATPVADVRRELLGAGVEHHVAIVPGDHTAVLSEVAGLWRIEHRHVGDRSVGRT